MDPQTTPTTGTTIPGQSIAGSGAMPPVQPAGLDAHPPAVAEDNDVIEDEWVVAAKHIIAGNRTDPNRQNQAIMQLRQAYLSKRYGRDIGTAK